MSAWGKYGDPGEIELHVGEPAFVLRGQDVLAPHALMAYAALVRAAAAGAEPKLRGDETVDQLREAHRRRDELRDIAIDVESQAAQMLAWQAGHRGAVKLPD